MSYAKFDEEVPIHITRFNHPVGDRGNLVTYGILQRLPPRATGDPSGWIIFNNCGADFEIEGKARIERIENQIESVAELNPVEKIEIDVERDEFIDAVSRRLSDDYVEIVQSNERMMNALNAGRAVLTELLTAYVFSCRMPSADVRWAMKRHNEEIDVCIHSETVARVVECKVNIDSAGVSSTIDQLARKVAVFDTEEREVQGEVWVWEHPSQHAVNQFDQRGIELNCLQEMSEVNKASTDGVKNVFETFLPESEDRHPLMPSKRFDW